MNIDEWDYTEKISVNGDVLDSWKTELLPGIYVIVTLDDFGKFYNINVEGRLGTQQYIPNVGNPESRNTAFAIAKSISPEWLDGHNFKVEMYPTNFSAIMSDPDVELVLFTSGWIMWSDRFDPDSSTLSKCWEYIHSVEIPYNGTTINDGIVEEYLKDHYRKTRQQHIECVKVDYYFIRAKVVNE